ncbi:ectonucleotide pyrophosphatase/phosphodiesterase family member 5-like [Mytilus edulis]|uniref:ectonucleotide pyrophosphatase/phosphodiesterase family member 5-like n=1 Tax=Mytilus edulis TaxID=6550 RepID=UPI0039EF0DDA
MDGRVFVVFTFMFVSVYSNQVLLVSMDGFRWDYLTKVSTPNFDRLAQNGTKASYINNTFITKTFPCHYTIVTGLYEESHGIIGNKMYDPVFNSTFNMQNYETRWWNGGEPIWVTARRQNLKSATYFWPGSEAEIRGYRPNIWKHYNQSVPFKNRIDTVITWLTDEHIDLVNLYFHEPDATGHAFGPDSPQIIEKVQAMDKILGYLLDKFDSHNLTNKVNLILTSDHGMTTIDTANKVVDITDHVNMSKIQFPVDNGPIMQIQPSLGLIDDVVQSLQNVSHISVFKKEDIPDHWHYRNNRRIMPVFLLADEGWSITTNKRKAASYHGKGAHGYDNRLNSMKPIFLARGPNIKENYTTNTFRSIDIYPMICNILGIQPAPNNGSLTATSSFLITSGTNDASAKIVSFWTFILCTLLVIM